MGDAGDNRGTALPTNIIAPVGAQKPGETVTELLPTTTQTIKYTLLNTNALLRSSPSSAPQAFGSLYLGEKVVAGINFHSVQYQPFSVDNDTELHDISSSVTVKPTEDDSLVNFIKVPDATSPYFFDITVKHYGGMKASFSHGTIKVKDHEWDWSGNFVTFVEQATLVTEIDVPKPAGWDQLPDNQKGTLAELRDISPIAHVGDGNTVKVGDDAAQIYADDILQNIMLSALDSGTINSLLPNCLRPLTANEMSILNNNRDFFERGAVHLLAERLKKDEKIPADISKHIIYRWDLYMKMLTAPPPTEKGDPDAAVVYGFTRGKDDALIKKLQTQFQDATMACYDLGYQKQCTNWSKFLYHPKYWYDVYHQLLLSEEHITQWTAHSTDTNDYTGINAIPGKDQVLMWTKKLSLLKHAAENAGEDASKMDIEHLSDVLLARIHEYMAFTQLLNDDFVKEVTLLYDIMEKTKNTKGFDDRFKQLSQEAREAAAAIGSATPHILSLLTQPNQNVRKDIDTYWSKRLPRAVGDVEMVPLTVAQVQEAVEIEQVVQNKSLLDRITAIDFKGGLKKVGLATLSAVKTLVKAALHGAAIFGLYAFLSGDTAHVSTSEMGTAIVACIAEGLQLVSWGVESLMKWGRIFNWALGKGGIVKTATAWFTNTIKAGTTALKRSFHALFGNVAKLIRIAGIIGCIFMLVTSYWGMKSAGTDVESQNYRTFSTIQFALGVVEGVALVGGIVFEMIGFAAGAAICGPLALIVGIIAGIVLIIYMIWFKPDPFKDIKGFLETKGKAVDSWNPNKEDTGPELVSLSPKEDTGLKTKPDMARKPNSLEMRPTIPPRLITGAQSAAAEALRMQLRQMIFVCSLANNPTALVALLRTTIESLNLLQTGNLYDTAVPPFTTGWLNFAAAWDPTMIGVTINTQFKGFFDAYWDRIWISYDTLMSALSVDA